MGLYEDLKAKEPFSLSCHSDPDGIYSATLLRRIFNIKGDIQLPPFNEYTTDVAVDLGFPFDKEWTGIAIDHHPDHPKDGKYKLYWDHCPTGLVIYNNLKEHIKKEDQWLVVGSLNGDGQPELTPDEIWDNNPVLLQGRGILYSGQWGKLGVSNYPMYVFLSSGINSMCRLGFAQEALNILENIRSPTELLENITVKDAIETMRKEESSVYASKPIVESFGNYALVRIRTSKPQVKICGLIGTKLSVQDNNMTYIVINESSGEISIRGTLAKYLANKLSAKGIKAGGHAKYCGAKVKETEVEQFVSIVRGLQC